MAFLPLYVQVRLWHAPRPWRPPKSIPLLRLPVMLSYVGRPVVADRFVSPMTQVWSQFVNTPIFGEITVPKLNSSHENHCKNTFRTFTKACYAPCFCLESLSEQYYRLYLLRIENWKLELVNCLDAHRGSTSTCWLGSQILQYKRTFTHL